MKYDHAYEMFYDMMNFAINNGMTSYQADLMHDAVALTNIENIGVPAELVWIVKSNGCGTWFWNLAAEVMPKEVANSEKSVTIKYDGKVWTADFK